MVSLNFSAPVPTLNSLVPDCLLVWLAPPSFSIPRVKWLLSSVLAEIIAQFALDGTVTKCFFCHHDMVYVLLLPSDVDEPFCTINSRVLNVIFVVGVNVIVLPLAAWLAVDDKPSKALNALQIIERENISYLPKITYQEIEQCELSLIMNKIFS